MRAGCEFRPRKRSSRAKSADALSLGRIADTIFQRAVDASRRPTGTSTGAKCASQAFSALSKLGVRVLRTQVPVQLGKLGTRLDGLGVSTVNGREVIVVIELKTTSGDPHDLDSYTSVCRFRPVLERVGLSNNEQTVHDLQAEFGRSALQHTYPSTMRYPVYSAVVRVSATTGTARFVSRFRCRDGSSLESVFKTTSVPVSAPTSVEAFQRFPVAGAGRKTLSASLKRLGWTRVISSGPSVPRGASCILVNNSGFRLIAGLRPRWHLLDASGRTSDENRIKRAGGTGIIFCKDGRWHVRVVDSNV